jgi:hypothetical protein
MKMMFGFGDSAALTAAAAMHNASNAPAHSFSFMALESLIIQPLGALKALASLRVSPDALRFHPLRMALGATGPRS